MDQAAQEASGRLVQHSINMGELAKHADLFAGATHSFCTLGTTRKDAGSAVCLAVPYLSFEMRGRLQLQGERIFVLGVDRFLIPCRPNPTTSSRPLGITYHPFTCSVIVSLQEAFRLVDFTYVTEIARLSRGTPGCEYFSHVTAQGSSSSSWFLYPKTKGEAEEAIAALKFKHTSIFRPG